ncbi:MAG: ester cyclase [Phycisphaerales bacterium]|nr:ester cyclase [Phycisphaerales bacterium]
MSRERHKTLVRRYYIEIVNTGDVRRIEEFISPEYVEVHDGKRYAVGIEGAKAHVLGVRQTYRDFHIAIDRQIAEGSWVVTCMTASGVHCGEWLGIAPTHRRVEFSGVNVDRVVDDRIVEHGGAVNLLGPLLEIGAIRVQGPDPAP